MTSERQLRANRANAQASTGPRSAVGKKRASQNARRHGLSLSVRLSPALSEKAEKLAGEIAGEGASPEINEAARRIADAEVDVNRVRRARQGLLTSDMASPNAVRPYRRRQRTRDDAKLKMRFIDGRLEFYDDAACEDLPRATLIEKCLSKEFAALDRYERRALSRRRVAIRDFDRARKDRFWQNEPKL
jgi:hypothetical protein